MVCTGTGCLIASCKDHHDSIQFTVPVIVISGKIDQIVGGQTCFIHHPACAVYIGQGNYLADIELEIAPTGKLVSQIIPDTSGRTVDIVSGPVEQCIEFLSGISK